MDYAKPMLLLCNSCSLSRLPDKKITVNIKFEKKVFRFAPLDGGFTISYNNAQLFVVVLGHCIRP